MLQSDWMHRVLGVIVLCLISVLAGCAARRAPQAPGAVVKSAPATAAADARALLPLDEIEPHPTLPPPATAPAGEAPLEAIELFARARDARFRNQQFNAINLLERAVRLDSDSFELNFELGSTYHRAGKIEEAILAYERAAELQSNDLVLQAELGRAYMQRGDVARGLQHLRLARLTDGYTADEAHAAAVDYRLGLALQQGGYDRAALDVYNQLLRRLQAESGLKRSSAEITYLLNRPELLLEQVGKLYEKQGQLDEALRAYRFIAERQPDDFTARARLVKTLMKMGRTSDAVNAAAEVVRDLRGSTDSLALLRDVYQRTGEPEAAVQQLQRLHADVPDDRGILFALADALIAVGRSEQSQQLLLHDAQRRGGDAEILGHLVQMLVSAGRSERAAQVVIESAATRPQNAPELVRLWGQIVSPGRERSLRVADVQALSVAPDAAAARLYFLALTAQSWNRAGVADAALRQSVAARPIFPPAFRARANQIWSTEQAEGADQIRRSEELIAGARNAGDEALAEELRGLALMGQKKFDEAQAALLRATELRDEPSAELAVAYATAVRAGGNVQRFEQLMWRLVSDHPQFSPGFATLFRHYTDANSPAAARNVLNRWLSSMPGDVDARLVEASVVLRFDRRPQQTERILLQLFREHPDRLEVLLNLRAYYTESGGMSRFIELMEQQVADHPYNYPALAVLVDVYESQRRLSEATRVLDSARAALAGDAERLYFVAQLYHRIDQPQIVQQVLEEVVEADPSFPSAANDLGYTWAEAGRNLARAEALVRRAVETEPHNPMFLDSLGWVLYKRGRFDEARRYLQQAVAAGPAPNPVIRDHLGDILYRLNDTTAAVEQWRLAAERISAAAGATNEQYNTLRLQLDQKLRQADRGEPVSVAPVVEAVPGAGQAKN